MIQLEIPNKFTFHSYAFIGTYLNLARHNIFLINNRLAEKFAVTQKLEDDEHIPNSFLGTFRMDNPNHLYSHLTHYFPFVRVYNPEIAMSKEEKKTEEGKKKIIEGKRYKELADDLKAVFKDINLLRNNFSHSYSKDDDFNRLLVSQATINFLYKTHETAITYCKRRFRDVFPEELFDHYTTRKLHVEDTNELTKDGLVFLCACFLEREQLFFMLNKLEGYKNTSKPRFKANRELLGAFALRLPHEKIKSKDPEMALNLEILNYLGECPKSLFFNLTDQDKKKFLPKINDEEKTHTAASNVEANSVPDDEIDIESYIQNLQSRYRKSDRNENYMLRLIDAESLLPHIKFQINVGKIQLASYEKMFLGKPIVRTIEDNVLAFGRLMQFGDQEEIEAKLKIDDFSNVMFNTFSPRHHITNNKIYFRHDTQSKDDIKLPTLILKENNSAGTITSRLSAQTPIGSLSKHEIHKVLLLEKFQKGEAQKTISDFLKFSKTLLKIISIASKIKWKNMLGYQ